LPAQTLIDKGCRTDKSILLVGLLKPAVQSGIALFSRHIRIAGAHGSGRGYSF